MNRKIKFRAWVDNGYIKEMHYTDQIEMNSADAWSIWHLLGFKDTYPEQHRLLDWQKEIKWMQFTGLLDKNGKEIYEGDTCLCFKDGNPIGANEVIEFRNASFWLRHRNYSMDNWLNYTSRDGDDFNGEFEIIGNIYENPEPLNIKP